MAQDFDNWINQAAASQIPDKNGLLLTVGQAMRTATIQRWEKEQEPSGKSWKPCWYDRPNAETKFKSRFEQRTRGKGRPIRKLIDKGTMFNSLHASTDPGGNSVGLGFTVDYAITHQLGIGRIPARPILDLKEEDQTETGLIEDVVNDFFENLIRNIL